MMSRERLISAANEFLLSAAIRDHDDEVKRKFLYDKGLTKDEVLKAFANSRRAKSPEPANYSVIMDKCLEEEGHLRNKSAPKRPAAPLLVVAALSSAALGLAIYLYRLFRRYMWPWLIRQWSFLTKKDDPGTDGSATFEMKEIVTSQSMVYELHDTISTIKSALDQQQSQITLIAQKDPDAVAALRREMDSIKRLLLSKESFPAPAPSQLPSWQIRKRPVPVQVPEPPNTAPLCHAPDTRQPAHQLPHPAADPDNTPSLSDPSLSEPSVPSSADSSLNNGSFEEINTDQAGSGSKSSSGIEHLGSDEEGRRISEGEFVEPIKSEEEFVEPIKSEEEFVDTIEDEGAGVEGFPRDHTGGLSEAQVEGLSEEQGYSGEMGEEEKGKLYSHCLTEQYPD